MVQLNGPLENLTGNSMVKDNLKTGYKLCLENVEYWTVWFSNSHCAKKMFILKWSRLELLTNRTKIVSEKWPFENWMFGNGRSFTVFTLMIQH
jgi:hypothetical protein